MTKKQSKDNQPIDWQTKAHEYLNGWKRAQADFINYKKTEEDRVQALTKYASQGVIVQLIDVLDNLDKVMQSIPKSEDKEFKNWLVGLEGTIKQFDALLDRHGVRRIEVGDTFDPTMHEAVDIQPSADKKSEGGQDRLQEVRGGYMMHDRVIRPARVRVITSDKQ
jgi:molecular chaperone GrpE